MEGLWPEVSRRRMADKVTYRIKAARFVNSIGNHSQNCSFNSQACVKSFWERILLSNSAYVNPRW